MSLEIEIRTIRVMIHIYCKSKHQSAVLCEDCQNLLLYTERKLNHCQWKDNKPACKDCITKCYNPLMKDKIKTVMKFSGPRMIYKYPILTLKHLLK